MLTVTIQGTGSVLLDMQNQLQANIVRINILEQENTFLRSTIEKLGQSAQKHASEVGPAGICVMLID